MPENSNFVFMAKPKVHIGKKIKEVLANSPMSVVDFAKSINLTRNGAYKVFEKETIDTGQLQVISKVLNHDFFRYYENHTLHTFYDTKSDYGFATHAEVNTLTEAVKNLTKVIQSLENTVSELKTAKTHKKAPRTKYGK
jgi:hypothetical protein